MKTELRHTLVQYHGGGYDGCFWEWNYFYINADGEFHCIEATGYAGCDTAEKADAMLAYEENASIDDYDGPPIHTYDVTEPADIAEFTKESNPVHIKGVLQWMNDNNIPFYTACTSCENTIEWANDLILENWYGCGGIASTADILLCSDCHSQGICDCCNEYVGADNITPMDTGHDTENERLLKAEIQMIQNGYNYVCDDCLQVCTDQIENDEQQELLATSLTTGTPDLFGDNMRWFWE